MATFELTQANILPDGQTVRLKFEAGSAVAQAPLDRLNDVGFMDYLPARQAGKAVKVNGEQTRIIGVQCEDWNTPIPWIDPPGAGGQFAAGEYFFLVTLVDAKGREVKVSPPVIGNSDNNGERGHEIPTNHQVTLHWRDEIPKAGSARIYVAKAKPLLENLRLLATVTSGNSVTLKSGEAPAGAPGFKRQSVCLTLTCAFDKRVTLGETATVIAPAGLCADGLGNATGAGTIKAVNHSVVNKNGQLAIEAMKFTDLVHISASRGNDATADGSLSKPYKTLTRAFEARKGKRNVRFSLLRGDDFAFESWTVAFPGESAARPTVFDSYWNPAYGPDPQTRPMLHADASSAPDPNGQRLWFRQYDHATGKVGDAPYQFFSGLAFLGDQAKGALPPIWPAGSPQDHIVVIGCQFRNVQLQPSYGSAMKRATVGNALINCEGHA